MSSDPALVEALDSPEFLLLVDFLAYMEEVGGWVVCDEWVGCSEYTPADEDRVLEAARAFLLTRVTSQ